MLISCDECERQRTSFQCMHKFLFFCLLCSFLLFTRRHTIHIKKYRNTSYLCLHTRHILNLNYYFLLFLLPSFCHIFLFRFQSIFSLTFLFSFFVRYKKNSKQSQKRFVRILFPLIFLSCLIFVLFPSSSVSITFFQMHTRTQ